MAKSAAVKIEVRWRETGTTQWSDIQSCSPAAQIVVEGLDRTKTYDFEWRGVSACGARSAWGSTSHAISDVPAGTIVLSDLKTEVDNAAADALAANAELANIASDNVLSQGEKPVVIRDTNVITTEQAGIDAQATAFGVTTQKTAYDNAVTALTTYLATLTTPVPWSDLTGDTTIVGTTFRGKFADVYTTRQALLNAIYAAAKAKADAAQATANAANANGPAVINPQLANGLTGWTPDYPTGWTVQTGGANLPDPIVNTAAVRTAGGGAPSTDVLRNAGHLPVVAGQQVTVACCVNEVGVNAGALGYARISWRNASGTEIGTSIPSGLAQYPTCGAAGTGTYTHCVTKVIASAPTGAQYAVAECVVGGHTAGMFLFCNVCMTAQPSSVDELPDGYTYLRQVQNSSSVSIPNANFQLPKDAQGNIPGWVETNTLFYLGTSALFGGMQCAVLKATYGSGNAGAQCTKQFKVSPGDSIWLGASVASLNGGYLYMRATVFAASGTQLAYIQPNTTATTATNIGGVLPTTPAGAAYVVITLGLVAPSVAGSIYAVFSSIDLRINDLRVAGSGAVLGNQLNAPNSLTLNYGAIRSSTALSATSAGAVSVNAFTWYMGAGTVSYSAVSNAITGLTQGVAYYIYCHDAGGTGGTKAWYATTNINALLQTYDDIVVAGQVTIPSSGSSGGGGTGTCVCDSMWMQPGLTAGDMAEGDEADCLDLPSFGDDRFRRALIGVERTPELCVRIETDGGAVLECSESTPFDLPGGGVAYAPHMQGQQVVTDRGIETVAHVEYIGLRPVSHLHFGGCSFAAGTDPAHRIYSHNQINKP